MLEYDENYQIKQHGICEEWRKNFNVSFERIKVD